jgi:hypothetical protein
LIGLNQLVEETGSVSMLDDLYVKCFPEWMKKYSQKIDECKAQNIVMGNDPHYDAIIQLLAASVQDNIPNIINFLKNDALLSVITIIIKNSTWEHKRYIPTLKLIAALANNDSVDERTGPIGSPLAADIFHQNLIHTMLLTQVKKSMIVYKKNHSLFDENSKETDMDQMQKY